MDVIHKSFNFYNTYFIIRQYYHKIVPWLFTQFLFSEILYVPDWISTTTVSFSLYLAQAYTQQWKSFG